jgi:hypothetical protein
MLVPHSCYEFVRIAAQQVTGAPQSATTEQAGKLSRSELYCILCGSTGNTRFVVMRVNAAAMSGFDLHIRTMLYALAARRLLHCDGIASYANTFLYL